MIDNLLPKAWVNTNAEDRRRIRLIFFSTLITGLATMCAGLLMLALGYTQSATFILSVIPLTCLGLVLLYFTRSINLASHYLTLVLFGVVVTDFGPASEFSILALTGVPLIAINLLGMRTGLIWSTSAIIWAIVVNPWMLNYEQFFTILSYGIGITTAGVTAAAVVVEVARANAVENAGLANQKVQKQRERIRMFAEQTFPGIAEVRGGVFQYVNPGLCELLGYKNNELLNVDTSSLIHPDDYGDMLESLVGVSADGFRVETRVRHGDGHWLWIELYGIPYGTPEEDCWIIAAHDYTEIKQSRENLLQAQRLEGVGVLAAGVAHDFNNLLTVITGFGELLPNSLERTEILKAAIGASELTNQLMAFGQRGPVVASSIDAVQAMKNLETLFESLLGARVILDLELDDTPLGVKLNTSQFNQIALNLVKNAKESIFDNGTVKISVHKVTLLKDEALRLSLTPGDYVQISFIDSGVGMSQRAADRAFDPFYSTKQPGEGSGLGLASTYGIVSQYGGSIKLKSKPAQGTTLTLHFPLTPLEDAITHSPPMQNIDGRAMELSILVVDDETNVRNLVCRVLENAGHTTTSASSAEDAIAASAKTTIDLVVSDIVMPGMRGTELVEALRDRLPKLPALLISGYTGDDVNLWLEADNHTRFLAKPFSGEELVSQIRKLSTITTAA